MATDARPFIVKFICTNAAKRHSNRTMAPSAKQRKTIVIVIVVALVLVVLAALGVGIWVAVRDSKRASANALARQALVRAPLFPLPAPSTPTGTNQQQQSFMSAAAGLPSPATLVPKVRAALQRSLQQTAATAGDFPIDAVVTWVDGTDAAWRADAASWFQRERQAFPRVAHAPAREPEPVPLMTRDELFYNVHMAAAHCPWLRTYFVVAARPQRPWWWPDSGHIGSMQLVLVYHDTIAPPGALLPTFNSFAIQSWLANIPGLAEHFILFDDDFFIGQPMQREHFFAPDGRPVLRTYKCNVSSLDVPVHATLWESVCAFTAAHIVAASGTPHRPHFTEHVAVPVLRSLWHELVTDWFSASIAQFRRFRSRTDIVLQYTLLGVLHALGEIRALPSNVQTVFYLTGRFGPAMAAAAAAKRPPPHMFCINDRMGTTDRTAMESIFASIAVNTP